MSISASDDDVEVSMEVTSVVGIFADVEDLIELEIISKSVSEIVGSSDTAIGLVKNVDIVCGLVVISRKFVVCFSLSSVDDNLSSNSSKVVVITLISVVDVDVTV
jgi:hypothetical protein